MVEAFNCAMCHGTFPKQNDDEWNDEREMKEFSDNYPELKNSDVGLCQVCDPCRNIFREWFETLTEEERIKMRDNP